MSLSFLAGTNPILPVNQPGSREHSNRVVV